MASSEPPAKRCPGCKRRLPIGEFPRNHSSRDGLATYCKPCHNRIMRANRIKHHGSSQNYLLKHRYGIDAVAHAWLLLRQDGACAICRTNAAEHVDHDHSSGAVRGILCFNCNRGVAKFGDSIVVMHKAIRYVKRTAKKP